MVTGWSTFVISPFFAILDPESNWGVTCTKFSNNCTGHYLKPEQHIEWVKEKGPDASQKIPPRAQIEKFVQANKDILPEDIDNLAKTHLLSREDAENMCSALHSKVR